MPSSNLLKSKIPMSGGRGNGTNFQLLMLSPNLLKSKIPMLRVGEGGLTEIDAEFIFAKIQNSYVEGGWMGGGS